MVLISARAKKELKKMGCGGPNFLRVSRSRSELGKCGFFVDSSISSDDEVIHDGEVKVVTDLNSAPFMNNLSIDIDVSGITVS